MRSEFDNYPWKSAQEDPDTFQAWTAGLTGFGLVDAGMRELWGTGHMHNRVRMVTASLLVKNLGIDWREGKPGSGTPSSTPMRRPIPSTGSG